MAGRKFLCITAVYAIATNADSFEIISKNKPLVFQWVAGRISQLHNSSVCDF